VKRLRLHVHEQHHHRDEHEQLEQHGHELVAQLADDVAHLEFLRPLELGDERVGQQQRAHDAADQQDVELDGVELPREEAGQRDQGPEVEPLDLGAFVGEHRLGFDAHFVDLHLLQHLCALLLVFPVLDLGDERGGLRVRVVVLGLLDDFHGLLVVLLVLEYFVEHVDVGPLLVDELFVQEPIGQFALLLVFEGDEFFLVEDGDATDELAEFVFVDEHALVNQFLDPEGVGHAGLQLDLHHREGEAGGLQFARVLLKGLGVAAEPLLRQTHFKVEVDCDAHVVARLLLESDSALAGQDLGFEVVLVHFGVDLVAEFTFLDVLNVVFVEARFLEVQNVFVGACDPFLD